MHKTKIDLELMISCQKALLCHVTASLRHVSIELIDNIVHWHCTFDSSAIEDDIELLSMAATEVIADYNSYGLKETYEKINLPEKGKTLKNLVYHRHEHNYFNN